MNRKEEKALKYQPLSKIFYKSPQTYESVYQTKINSESTYLYDFKIGKYQAFVVICPEILDQITQIFQIDKKLQLLDHQVPNVALTQYSYKCIIDEVKQTNDIEGVYSTRKEISEVLRTEPGHGTNKRFYGIIQKYLMLLKKWESSSTKLQTCEDIRKLYDDLVLKEVVQEDPDNKPDGTLFRKSGVDILSPDQQIIHRGIEPEKEIIHCLTQALGALNDKEKNPLISIAVFHYMFGYIHPFYDGNGRTSRFISSYLLSEQLENLVSLRLSYTIKKHKSGYYKAFNYTNDKKNRGDMTSFVIIFFEILIDDITSLCESLKDRQDKLDYYEIKQNTLMNQDRAQWNKNMENIFYVLIQNSLFGEIGLNVKEIAKATTTSVSTVRNSLHEFPSEYLRVIHDGKKKLYDVDLEALSKIN